MLPTGNSLRYYYYYLSCVVYFRERSTGTQNYRQKVPGRRGCGDLRVTMSAGSRLQSCQTKVSETFIPFFLQICESNNLLIKVQLTLVISNSVESNY